MIGIHHLGLSLVLVGGLLVAKAPEAQADQAHDVTAIQNFQLTDDFFSRVQASATDIDKDPCRLGFVKLLMGPANGSMSLDEIAAQYDAQPGVRDMLAGHSLRAKEMLIGAAALMAVAASEDAQSMGYSRANTANLAFFKAHRQAIQQFSMQLAQQQLQMDDGKLPGCPAQ